jgi:hypothetical protein
MEQTAAPGEHPDRRRDAAPKATVDTTKRAVLIEFNDAVGDEDPSVDLIVGLARKEDDAMWIPHLDGDRWDPAHPEEHTRLLTNAAQNHSRNGVCDARRRRHRHRSTPEARVVRDRAYGLPPRPTHRAPRSANIMIISVRP